MKKRKLGATKNRLEGRTRYASAKANERVERTNAGLHKYLNLRGENRLGAISARDCSFCAKNWNEPPHFRKNCFLGLRPAV